MLKINLIVLFIIQIKSKSQFGLDILSHTFFIILFFDSLLGNKSVLSNFIISNE